MNIFLVRLGLRLLAVVDTGWFWVRRIKNERTTTPSTAGAGVQSDRPIATAPIGTVVWPEFPSLAHSFWRAQELTLFREHHQFFFEPALDLGCGDSLFGSLAGFPRRGFGIDCDDASLSAARRLNSPLQLIRADASQLPLEDACVMTCLSNSVLEHLPDLDRCFSEVWRVLKPGGFFIFSITLGLFTSQLSFWSGQQDAKRWIQFFGHLQQPSADELLKKLATHGFTVRACIAYQSPETTALYRLLVSPCFQFLERLGSDSIRRRLRNWLAPKVAESLHHTPQGNGACLFVVASKNPA